MMLARLAQFRLDLLEVRAGAPAIARVQMSREQTVLELFRFSDERLFFSLRRCVSRLVGEHCGQQTPDIFVVGRASSHGFSSFDVETGVSHDVDWRVYERGTIRPMPVQTERDEVFDTIPDVSRKVGLIDHEHERTGSIVRVLVDACDHGIVGW